MDNSKYSSTIKIITYATLGFCWAGKFLLPIKDMVFVGFVCLLLGISVECAENLKAPVYVSRPIGIFIATLAIIAGDNLLSLSSDNTQIIVATILPVATGAMLIDGIYHYINVNKNIGKKKIITSIYTAIGFSISVSLALIIMEV